MKYLIWSTITIVGVNIISDMFAGVGVSDAYMSYVNGVSLSVACLAGVVSFWGYMIFDKLDKLKEK